MPKFSVVIPTFNQCNYLAKALKSVIDQSFEDFEIIVIDNYSSDKTSDVVKSFDNSKIIYEKFNNKGIIGASRNLGINKAKGEWIAFLDSDDWWHKNKLEVISKCIDANKNTSVFCSNEKMEILNKDVKKLLIWGPYTKDFYKNLLLRGNCVSTSASVVKKNFLDFNKISFSEDFNIVTAEDYDFFLKIALANGKFHFINEVLGVHLVHEKSMSSNYFYHRKSVLTVIDKHLSNNYKNLISKQILKLRSIFSLLVLDLKFYLAKKNYIKSFVLSFFLFLFYPDRCIEFLLKKKKTSNLTKKYFTQ